MSKGRALLVDCVLLVLTLYYTAPEYERAQARIAAWWHLAQALRWTASHAGRAALGAEARYYREIQA